MYGHTDDLPEVSKFILSRKGKIFVDVGANTGFYALNLCRSFEKIYAYEPFPYSAHYIQSAIILSKLENVEVREIAISDFVGEKEFYLSPRGPKCHSLLPVGNRTIKVPCSTIAREFKKTQIDLIKVDVEGSEFEVLRGAEPVIKRIKSWVIEVHNLKEICGKFATVKGSFEDRCREMEEALRELDYETKWITERNVIYAWRRNR